MKTDQAQLDDLHAAIEALKKAESSLLFAMAHHGPKSRDAFIFHVGMASGRLSLISDRIYGEPPGFAVDSDGESDP